MLEASFGHHGAHTGTCGDIDRALGSERRFSRAERSNSGKRREGFAVRGSSTCKGTEGLVLLFPSGWEEAWFLMDKQKHRGSR